MGVRARRLLLELARHVTPYVAVDLPDGRFLVSTRDAGIGRVAFVFGENPEFETLGRAVEVLRANGRIQTDGTFIDVGANIGTTVVPALLRHGYERAVCFEPETDNLPVLAANVALNGLAERVEIVNAAVSDVAGRGSFGRGPMTRLGRRTGVGSLSRSDGGTVEIEIVTLDEALSSHGVASDRVGLLWIDAQGYEGHVLRGAPRLLATGVPLVFALRREKLKDAGGIEPLLAGTAGYRSFVDLRVPSAGAARIDALADRVRNGPNTDILVF